MHHPVLETACVDIDGVLCANPEGHESGEGKAYQQFLESARQLHATSGKIGWLVTSRTHHHRAQTEAWLDRHGIQYDQLVMATDKEKQNSPAYKAKVYAETGASIFIESEAHDASVIADLSGRPVICIESFEMITPGQTARVKPSAASKQQAVTWRNRKSAAKLMLRSALGNDTYYSLKKIARNLNELVH